MDKRIFATTNRVKPTETFLTAVTVKSRGAQTILIELFTDRAQYHFVTRKGFTALLRVDSTTTIDDLIDRLDGHKAMLEIVEGEVFIIVGFAAPRLRDALIRSAKAFRMLRHPVRIIESERDLLNSHTVVPTRVYKDDE